MAALLIFVLVVLVGYYIWIGYSKATARDDARDAYTRALRALKQDPTNAELREAALARGRHLARLEREGGETVFDEAAVGNDIAAACAAMARQPTPPTPSAPAEPIEARLGKLQHLRELGLVSDDEFRAKRKAILDEV
jgi:hypothetical protein